MLCPTCGTAFDGHFCPNCGNPAQPFAFLCTRCGAAFNGLVCPYCGTPLGGPAPGSGARAAGSVVWSIGILAFLLLIAMNLIALFYASWLIVDGALSAGPQTRLIIQLYVLLPYPMGDTFDVSVAVFLAYFALIVTAILAAYGWYGYRDAKPTAEAFARPLDHLVARLESRSAWVATGQVFLAATFFQIMYILILEAGGFVPQAPTGSLPLPPWYDYFALANASVYEEFVTRWVFIGVPLFFAGLAMHPGPGLRAALGTSARHLLGGTLNRDSPPKLVILATVLVFVSSIIFGLAHVPYWGAWKFLPSMVAGLGMGYLFVRRGLLAAILFHFATDYLAVLALLSSDSLGAQILLGLFILVLVGIGSFFFVWYFVYSARIVNHFSMTWRAPAAAAVSAGPAFAPPTSLVPPAPPSLTQSTTNPLAVAPFLIAREMFRTPPSGTSFVCRRCGWLEARYDAGRFTCLRCGQAYP